ncbi:MAG: radical SAM protein [Bdellovibrionaceae bacterium]|nr:radical SAM protein [Bdellovibrionales bacterium]MCB9086659.1 radical SAM protein [Pseudobdellovibrionaceae bacterium]
MYHRLETIEELHIEITNKCNAACPMCDRNFCGGATRPELQLAEWSQDDIPRVFDSRLKGLRNVLFCGTHGDPMVAKHSLEAVEFVKSKTKATVEFYSNASGRTQDWWSQLGRLLGSRKQGTDSHYRQSDLGIFSIDGLKETNSLYRRNTNFNKIMESAEAFIAAGGIARWDFIVFEHNQHQVEEARTLAKKMGFKQFRVRKTARFNYSPLGPEQWPVYSREGEVEYTLRPPTIKEYLNEEVSKFEELVGRYGSPDGYFEAAKINCLYRNKFRRIYVNAEARVFPCCYLANDIIPRSGTFLNRDQQLKVPAIRQDTMEKVFKVYEDRFNDLRIHSWNDVLGHKWLREDLEKSWEASLGDGRLKRCARTCGDAYSPIMSQSHDEKLVSPDQGVK